MVKVAYYEMIAYLDYANRDNLCKIEEMKKHLTLKQIDSVIDLLNKVKKAILEK
jgi:hypothetical protein